MLRVISVFSWKIMNVLGIISRRKELSEWLQHQLLTIMLQTGFLKGGFGKFRYFNEATHFFHWVCRLYSFVSMTTVVVPAASPGFHYGSEVKLRIKEVKLRSAEVKLRSGGQVTDSRRSRYGARRSSYGAPEVTLRIVEVTLRSAGGHITERRRST